MIYCILDTETTGLIHQGGEIVELAIIICSLSDGKYHVVSRHSWIINEPGRRVPEKIQEINKITDKIIEKRGISEERAFNLFSILTKSCDLFVGFNSTEFDNILINKTLKKLNLPLIKKENVFDVMKHYISMIKGTKKDRYKSWGSFHSDIKRSPKIPSNLIVVADAYGIKIDEKELHSAAYDCEVTNHIFIRNNPFNF